MPICRATPVINVNESEQSKLQSLPPICKKHPSSRLIVRSLGCTRGVLASSSRRLSSVVPVPVLMVARPRVCPLGLLPTI